jgi:hypothetical protein
MTIPLNKTELIYRIVTKAGLLNMSVIKKTDNHKEDGDRLEVKPNLGHHTHHKVANDD